MKEGIVTNSRWQGSKYFGKTGFAWVDYFTKNIKAFFVEEGIYSKNIVKLSSLVQSALDKYLVAVLNSKFISYYIRNFITTTHTLQINDGRLIPVIIPPKKILIRITLLVDQLIGNVKKDQEYESSVLEGQIDQIIYELYGLTEEEIKIVEST